ncbi:hypothetical protein DX888_24030 [Vibrio alginolyticus]|nr:hypothetical protein [Vibrio alginolyticus]EGR2553705.1 hypothetical protein [Vibrio alginolyticus]EIL2910655.1 hypothetical protein [Vibrio alginolyticus]EKP4442004.1 hypothetical protein [Vibrio alginolyticus]ELA7317163.1 hypothetical protein [Vibrio alginolyticus]
MARTRIAVLTLSSGQPRLMLAGVNDGQLHIIECQQLERSLMSLKLTLPEKLEKLKRSGFIVLVDEVTPYFSKYGRAVRLSALDAKGRPIIVSAMEAYNYLSSLNAITYPPSASGRFEVSPSIVEEVRGTDGQPMYNIDWSELRPDTYALMFVVYAATQDSIGDTVTLKSLFDLLRKPKKEPEIASRAMGLFKAKTGLISDGKYRMGGDHE